MIPLKAINNLNASHISCFYWKLSRCIMGHSNLLAGQNCFQQYHDDIITGNTFLITDTLCMEPNCGFPPQNVPLCSLSLLLTLTHFSTNSRIFVDLRCLTAHATVMIVQHKIKRQRKLRSTLFSLIFDRYAFRGIFFGCWNGVVLGTHSCKMTCDFSQRSLHKANCNA